MRILILGQGGREHALVRALKFSPSVTEVHVVPGSEGISRDAICHAVDLSDSSAIETFVRRHRFDCVVIGPENGLTPGLADDLRGLGLAVVGPSDHAIDVVRGMNKDLPSTTTERAQAVKPYLSYSILTDGTSYQALPVAMVYERLRGGNDAPDTEGVGAYAPADLDPTLLPRLEHEIVTLHFERLKQSGAVYRGALTFRIQLTSAGPELCAIRPGFGDLEASVILPLLEGDWGQVLLRLARGELKPFKWRPLKSACVVLAAPGCPASPPAGVVIEGDLGFEAASGYFLHAGTRRAPTGEWMTRGGRVLNCLGLGSTLAEAVASAYAQAKHARWTGREMRADIGPIPPPPKD